jgi:hypothetical protein
MGCKTEKLWFDSRQEEEGKKFLSSPKRSETQ